MSALINTLNLFAGYRLTEKIYAGNKTLVYRGIREQDQKSVIIKLMQNEYPTFSEIAQFRNQYNIIKNLDIKGIVQPLSLENCRNGYALIMEDFGGLSLKEWQLSHQKIEANCISLDEFFPIAIEITSILEELHRDRIIHKDIKPANILIHPTSGEVKIIDFSLATLLPREIQFLTNPNVLEGTLAYISPEQTGRMNRGIDYRTDFYSLGVTLFELLTGQLPFTTTDPMELVYCHIAKEAPKVSQINPNIPQILSDIIDKLMAKNAEDRYQSSQGLKHDLENCRQLWQDTGDIPTFELGLRDFCDRFLIPEKLYGRQQEVETLLAAFERVASGKTEMVLVTGSSGIGKTAVVNEVHKPIVRQRSYFIKGKFDQFQRDIPLSGLVQAFRDLIGQLFSETDAQIQQWKTKILSALGEQSQLIIDVIPELELILGKQPEVTELSGSAAQNRFNLLFQRFIQVFSSKEHPLVIFLDDLQWADVTSLKFIQLLMSENTSSQMIGEIENQAEIARGLLLIGAYRDNEVSQAHPLYLKLQDIEKIGVKINNINLAPLTQSDLNHLIVDTLYCQETTAAPLTQMVFAKTKGNPFFANQFLQSLHDDNLIKFNFDTGFWEYDIREIEALSLTDDVVKFMALQIEKLPVPTQNVLMLASCIGNEFDLKTLAIVHEKSAQDTSLDLLPALRDGLVLPQNEAYKLFQNEQYLEISIDRQEKQALQISNFQFPKYKFVHDRIQQAAYSLIPVEEKKPIHLKIGILLLSNIPLSEREEKIFELVNQFNIALEFITHQSKRNNLAEMNLMAGRKALASTAYSSALKYLKIGIELLADDSWDSKYELTLALYETAAEAAYLAGEFAEIEHFVALVLSNAKTLLDQVKVFEVKIEAYKAQSQSIEAITTGLQVLKLFGFEFPEHPTQETIGIALQETKLALVEKNIEELVNLPQMTDLSILAVMNILVRLLPICAVSNPLLFILLVNKQVNLSLQFGNCAASAMSYGTYGIILWNIWKDVDLSYKFGQLALNILAKFNAIQLKAIVIFVVNMFIKSWKEHIEETLSSFLEAYTIALETGDLEHAAYSLYMYSEHAFWQGKPLLDIEQEMAKYHEVIFQLKQEIPRQTHASNWQAALNLLGKSEEVCCLSGQAYDENIMLPLHQQVGYRTAIFHLHLHKLFLCYLFQDYLNASQQARLAANYIDSVPAKFVCAVLCFYESLVMLQLYETANQSEKTQILELVAINQEKMKNWANHAPMNFLHKYYLVEAERARIDKQYIEAVDYYDRAISLANKHKYLQEEALANELAAKFYLGWDKLKIAKIYLTDAYYGYIRWGALAKVEQLEKSYPHFLASTLSQEKLNFHNQKTNISADSLSLTINQKKQTINTSQTSISDSLDLFAVIKASQAVSEEIEFERLLSTLIEVVMENAGASKCALLLSKGENFELNITAISSNSTFAPNSVIFPGTTLELSNDVPVTLINYVKRTREILVIDQIKADKLIIDDLYINHHQPKSILCMPIINQGKLLGILYLENNLATAAFTRNRVELLKLLITQAAISLKNAILYNNLNEVNSKLEGYNHTLEEKVKERTQEINEKNQTLQQAMLELQQTQIQLIQSEKMSSLGQMVAGIAHEINNPINFIHGNIAHINEYAQGLVDFIALYRQECSNYSDLLEEKAEEIDIDFIAEDLPKLLDSMKIGSSRIRNIILGLRNFSRLDESDMKPVDIHEGIDNTLMILQHRLHKPNDKFEIEVIKKYGKLATVNCYAGQLNQVFMNIINNAIDALEESFLNKNKQENQQLISKHPQISINTQMTDSKRIRIAIADNGFGMTEAVQQKIFDPFFTTKEIGSGMGLGLSISYQIVVEQHKGLLSCSSTPGAGTEFIIEIPLQ
ncbi:AAA family ATPase [Calothrix sp. FACHB-1219]|uniref:ATP-binding sensor histidine kinase n=1 Tax=unclassified Calothrix TaxID=2619626 RepID=UPI0016878587|nr:MULTISPECIES: ATP-binding sensor histidine kinase [unclassified Calothrix]MBD2204366.1 AAA family ATPase [Calothrix sp. FACHB-168]MBD2221889.1 AAA family ATPase [Calothrix sp. FACHB-1219]